MSVDRSKFRQSSASQLQQADKDLNKTLGRKERTNLNGHTIDEGANLFRFYPVHPDISALDENALFAIPYAQTFLPGMVQEKDTQGNLLWEDKEKKIPKLKVGVRPVWNTKVHGNMPKDLVEEFINLAKLQVKDRNMSEEAGKEYLKPIYGAFSRDKNKNINGINYTPAWVVYADKYPNGNPAATPVFDELRLKKSVKERLNIISRIEASTDPLGTEPFTHLEEGKAVKIWYDPKSEQAANYYTTELDNSSVKEVVNGKTYNLQKTYPLTDDQLTYFLEQEPLHTKYGKKLATRKNFEAQLTGLEMLDSKWRMGIFELPAWEKIVAEIDAYYPEQDAADDTKGNSTTASAVTAHVDHKRPGVVVEPDTIDETTSDDGTDEFELMNRQELIKYATEQKTGIVVRQTNSDEMIREKLRDWKLSLVEIPHIDLPGENELQEGKEIKPEPLKEEVKKEVVAKAVSKSPLKVVKDEAKNEEKDDFLDELNSGKVNKTDVVSEDQGAVETPQQKLARLRAKMKTSA